MLEPPDDRDGCPQDAHWFPAASVAHFNATQSANVLSTQILLR
jgi:hypothetical protein